MVVRIFRLLNSHHFSCSRQVSEASLLEKVTKNIDQETEAYFVLFFSARFTHIKEGTLLLTMFYGPPHPSKNSYNCLLALNFYFNKYNIYYPSEI